ncbi:MAG TPA: TIGR04551 family protein [Myxococcota bacterium]|nr:TIGR04551 family protein [Myxococcota bacterium]HQK50327.1 TIGR04551 family protein [Myxococcota bacterium]
MTGTLRWTWAFLVVAAVARAETPPPEASGATPPGATGEEPLPGVDDLLGQRADEAVRNWSTLPPQDGPSRTFPWFEHHGYFRLRIDGYWRPHLGTEAIANGATVNTSAYRPPLNANVTNHDPGQDWIGGANMRLRWAPVLHVSPRIEVQAEVDVLDNLVLGSTPDADPDRADAPLPIYSRSQAPASATRLGGRDPVTVKQAFVSWTPFLPKDDRGFLLRLSGGRMARQWGLGILENAGRDLDSDYGTYQDRVNLLARIGGIYTEVGYTWVASGPNTMDPSQPYGETHDLSNADDVWDLSLAIFRRPDTEAEKRKRYRDLVVLNRPVVDGGGYLVFRRQNLDVKPAMDGSITAMPTTPYDEVALEKRNGWMLTPDVWLRLEWKPSLKEHVRIEAEFAGVFGHIQNVPRFRYDSGSSSWQADGSAPLDIRSFGGALEGEYVRGPISTGLYAGFATGTAAPWWGWRDRNNVTTNRGLQSLRSFYFHPDYRVDQLLFRNVVGTITNAWYVKPFVQYDLFEGDRDALAGRLEVLYGRAFEARATPGGKDPNLGVELLVRLFYEEKGAFYAGLDWATLFPFDGLDLPATYGCPEDGSGNLTACHAARNARWSMAVRGRFGVMF